MSANQAWYPNSCLSKTIWSKTLGSTIKITCLQVTSSLTLGIQRLAHSHKYMLSCVIFLCSWCSRNCGGNKPLRVITSYRNPLKFKLFGLPSYCTSISFCFIRRISTHWLIQIFLYQWLFSVFCSYLLLPRTKTFHHRVSILGDMWNSTEHDTQQADETLKLDCCEQESKQAEIPPARITLGV